MVSNPGLVTISDHFLVFVDINQKSPKQAPTYVVTRSFRNYKADQFATDIAHIPWDTVNLGIHLMIGPMSSMIYFWLA